MGQRRGEDRRRDKGINVRGYIEKYFTTPERTVSIGNSYTDIPMFQNSGLSIAFNPTDEYTSEAATHTVNSDNIADVLDFIIGDGEERSLTNRISELLNGIRLNQYCHSAITMQSDAE